MSLYSEESDDKGLGFIKGNVIRLKNHKTARVPHFGWNKVFHNSDILFLGINQKERFYFCHSYYLDCYEDKSKLYFTKYGIEFCCGFHIDNIFGLQFHPEKSFESGKKLIQNFCQYT